MKALCKSFKKIFPDAKWQVFSDRAISFENLVTFSITKSKDIPNHYLIKGSKYKAITPEHCLRDKIASLFKECSYIQSTIDRLAPLLRLLNITPTVKYLNSTWIINFNLYHLFYTIYQETTNRKPIISRTSWCMSLPLEAPSKYIDWIKTDLIAAISSDRSIKRNLLQQEYLTGDQRSGLVSLVCSICNQQTELLILNNKSRKR